MNRRHFLGATAVGMTGALLSFERQRTPAGPVEKGTAWICIGCGTQFPPSPQTPSECPICQDSRQYVGWNGQQWTSLDELSKTHENAISQEEPDLYSIYSKPDFAIGQRAFLVRTREGNLLWDCVALLDDRTKAEVRKLGGIAAIAISHPHYYTTMLEWSRAFGGAPIYLHELNRKWVVRPDPAIRFWTGDTSHVFGGATLIKTGGHFDGFQVLHWAKAGDGQSVLLAGDQPEVCMDRRWVTFMYSYPNYIPLNRPAIEGILTALEPYSFDKLYAAFPGRFLANNARETVIRSAQRYLKAIS